MLFAEFAHEKLTGGRMATYEGIGVVTRGNYCNYFRAFSSFLGPRGKGARRNFFHRLESHARAAFSFRCKPSIHPLALENGSANGKGIWR